MSKLEDRFRGVAIDYNYGTPEESAKYEDAILIEKNDTQNLDECISVSVEEARWMAEKLVEFADKLDEIKSVIPDVFYFKIPSDKSNITFKCIKKNDNLHIVYWNYDTQNVPYYLSEVKERLAKGTWRIIETEVM